MTPDMDPALVTARLAEQLQTARQRGQWLRQLTVTEPIGPGLGELTVGGNGLLQNITIDERALAVANEDVLARKIVEAVNRADEKIATIRANRRER
jgi:DNA-binding protein YbaB